jgi:lipoprotein Spr
MILFKTPRFILPILFVFAVVAMTGCSSTRELTMQGATENLQKKETVQGVNAYTNSSELVATNTFSVKTSLSKGNLESLSSSLAGSLASSDLNYSYMKDELMNKIIEYINTPYLWGGTSKSGIDCSAFVQTVMYNAFGVSLPRTSFEQSLIGEDVTPENLQFGDLLFFDTMHKGRVTHVAIYLKDGYFAHSGSRTGVAIASLNDSYYTETFLRAKRVVK